MSQKSVVFFKGSLRNRAGLFHHVPIYMGDLNLVLSALNLFALEAGHFDNGATSKIDYVLTKHGGIIHVLPLAVHLKKY